MSFLSYILIIFQCLKPPRLSFPSSINGRNSQAVWNENLPLKQLLATYTLSVPCVTSHKWLCWSGQSGESWGSTTESFAFWLLGSWGWSFSYAMWKLSLRMYQEKLFQYHCRLNPFWNFLSHVGYSKNCSLFSISCETRDGPAFTCKGVPKRQIKSMWKDSTIQLHTPGQVLISHGTRVFPQTISWHWYLQKNNKHNPHWRTYWSPDFTDIYE